MLRQPLTEAHVQSTALHERHQGDAVCQGLHDAGVHRMIPLRQLVEGVLEHKVEVVSCTAHEPPILEGLDVVGGVVSRLGRLLLLDAELRQHSLRELEDHAARVCLCEEPGDQDVDLQVEVGINMLRCHCGVIGSRQLVFPEVRCHSDVCVNLKNTKGVSIARRRLQA